MIVCNVSPISPETPDTRSIALSADIRKLTQFLDAVKLQKPVEGTGKVSGLFTYRVDEAGKLTLLRSFWDFEAMTKTLF